MLAKWLEMEGLGKQLSAARIARNLSIDDVAARIHMRPEYILALEEERWSDIGDPLYVRGFLRTYAHFLDLSAERFIAEYRAKAPDGIKLLGPQTAEEVEQSVKRAGNSLAAFFAVAAVAILIGGGLIAFVVRSANSAAAVASDAAVSTVTAAPLATAVISPRGALTPAPRQSPLVPGRSSPAVHATPNAAETLPPAAFTRVTPADSSESTTPKPAVSPAPAASHKSAAPRNGASARPENRRPIALPQAQSMLRRIELPPAHQAAAPVATSLVNGQNDVNATARPQNTIRFAGPSASHSPAAIPGDQASPAASASPSAKPARVPRRSEIDTE